MEYYISSFVILVSLLLTAPVALGLSPDCIRGDFHGYMVYGSVKHTVTFT
eukprot:gene13300-3885_t